MHAIQLIFFCYLSFTFSCVLSYQDIYTMRRSTIAMMARGFKASPSFNYSGKLRPGIQSPTSVVPANIIKPNYAEDGIPKVESNRNPWEIEAQNEETIAKMRVAGKIAREVLDAAIRIVQPGITTNDIDVLVHKETIQRNSYPSPLNYGNFPKSCCTSLNEVICHGIPDSTVLNNGDIINIDVTVFHNGVHGDCSETVLVGEVDQKYRDLVQVTYDSLQAAIAICKPGVGYNEIGGVVESVIAPRGYRSVKEFCGHGIHSVFHDFPNVLHYRNNERCGVMEPGHTFTIEPMICMGSSRSIKWPDDWTAATRDGSYTAQFEHTLVVTKTGVEALTAKLPTSPKFFWEK